MSRYQCWNCLTHHSGDYERCNSCIAKGRDKPTMWRPGPNYVPPSNADVIRRMSDEALAKFLAEPCCCDVDPGCDGYRECGNDLCLKYLIDWLQQPAEGDT